MFRHDMSEFQGGLPDPDGWYRRDRLEPVLRADPDWAAYLVVGSGRPVGLALVRGLIGPRRVLNAFFVVRAVRRTGIGLRAAREVLERHPGAWELAFQDANEGAARFWRRVAGEIAGESWAEERRPVPGRDDVPPDVWISFAV
ncbi:GNAT family N-acetyltransferase [Streptomyces sp. DSM 42041]|uniref:GNAT family N-acetyltransferase n=2 Tax=Streptomyces hazeniae TaxID=3075538 RepID=A0ABU2NYM2_9ACTN|nr:GNAT family N-acetyltransferase [Streptomyces sp. DSM 42041]MDT0381726.1 GNAT family N-acetyltransferase [Streptomyces sp. DSM 42041]